MISEPTNRDENLTRVEATTSSGTPLSSPSNADPASPLMPLTDPSSPMDVGLAAAFALSNSTEVRPSVALPVVAGQLIEGQLIDDKYKLIQAIGEGGMGSVWLAEQKEPVKRKVALKLVKAGMDSRSVLARFEAERQALAVMDHPNIAKVLDGGLTEQGRPYFVMEYVKGIPITEYWDTRKLSVPERLQLFALVCQAVQHAHHKVIIHRDLKPSNILVAPCDDKPIPKLIDIGLAKAIHQSLTENTLHTAHDMVLGTPLYMSPEQAQLNNIDIDSRQSLRDNSPELARQLVTVSLPLLNLKAWADAEPLLREALAIREKIDPNAWTTFNTKSMLGGALLGQKKYIETESLLLAGYEGM